MEVGSTRLISIIFIFIYLGVIGYIHFENPGSDILETLNVVWPMLIPIVIFIGVIRRTIWGRWLAYPLAAISLVGVPIGTLLGFFMILHLTRHRKSFNQWI